MQAIKKIFFIVSCVTIFSLPVEQLEAATTTSRTRAMTKTHWLIAGGIFATAAATGLIIWKWRQKPRITLPISPSRPTPPRVITPHLSVQDSSTQTMNFPPVNSTEHSDPLCYFKRILEQYNEYCEPDADDYEEIEKALQALVKAIQEGTIHHIAREFSTFAGPRPAINIEIDLCGNRHMNIRIENIKQSRLLYALERQGHIEGINSRTSQISPHLFMSHTMIQLLDKYSKILQSTPHNSRPTEGWHCKCQCPPKAIAIPA